MKRALLLTEVLPPRVGGSGRWFWELYRRLPRENFTIVAGISPGADVFDSQHNLDVVRLPLTWPRWGVCNGGGIRHYWQTARAVRRLMRARGAEVIHCGKCLPEGFIAYMLRCTLGIPYICYVHGEETHFAFSSRELYWLSQLAFRGAGRIIANSCNSQAILHEKWGIDDARVHVLHPGADTQWFVPAPPNEDVRQRLGWQGRLVLLTVGRFQRRKGQDQVIRALPALRQRFPSLLYSIVGDGEDKEYLHDLVVSLGLQRFVQFMGEVDDRTLRECYQQCDVFVLPNRHLGNDLEGFGMVFVEAQACGKPVVAGATGGTRETMRVPETGRLLSEVSPDALVVSLSELLASETLREQMGAAARAWVADQFAWEAVRERALGLFGQFP